MSETKTVVKQEAKAPVKQPSNPFALALSKGKATFKQIYGDEANEKFLKEYGFAIMQSGNNKQLQACNPDSIRNAIIQIALTGLTLNPVTKYAYLVPRGSECCLDISYLGMINVLMKTKSVNSVDVGVVFKGDSYTYRKGDDAFFTHSPSLENEDDSQDNCIAAYATFSINGEKVTYLLTKKEIMNHKKQSKSAGSNYSPWNGDFWRAMWIKTVIRDAYKYLPKTEQAEKVIEVLAQDNKEFEKNPEPEISYE